MNIKFGSWTEREDERTNEWKSVGLNNENQIAHLNKMSVSFCAASQRRN